MPESQWGGAPRDGDLARRARGFLQSDGLRLCKYSFDGIVTSAHANYVGVLGTVPPLSRRRSAGRSGACPSEKSFGSVREVGST